MIERYGEYNLERQSVTQYGHRVEHQGSIWQRNYREIYYEKVSIQYVNQFPLIFKCIESSKPMSSFYLKGTDLVNQTYDCLSVYLSMIQ